MLSTGLTNAITRDKSLRLVGSLGVLKSTHDGRSAVAPYAPPRSHDYFSPSLERQTTLTSSLQQTEEIT